VYEKEEYSAHGKRVSPALEVTNSVKRWQIRQKASRDEVQDNEKDEVELQS